MDEHARRALVQKLKDQHRETLLGRARMLDNAASGMLKASQRSLALLRQHKIMLLERDSAGRYRRLIQANLRAVRMWRSILRTGAREHLETKVVEVTEGIKKELREQDQLSNAQIAELAAKICLEILAEK